MRIFRNSTDLCSHYSRWKRSEIRLKRNVLVSYWDASKSRARKNFDIVQALNAYLDKIFTKLLSSHAHLIEKDNIISPQAIALYSGID